MGYRCNDTNSKIIEIFTDLSSPDNPRERVYYSVPDHEETCISVVSDPEYPNTLVQVLHKHDPRLWTERQESKKAVLLGQEKAGVELPSPEECRTVLDETSKAEVSPCME